MSEGTSLADRVRRARRRKKLTQQELADLADVKLGVVGGLERGKTTPTPANQRAILKALSIDPDEVSDAPDPRLDYPDDIESFVHIIRMTLNALPLKERTPVMFDMTRQAMELMSRRQGDDRNDDLGDDA